MSASLVGSEMCIRDSASPDSESVRTAPQNGPDETFGERVSAHASSREPVSYTHLTLPTICSV
eukprot:9710600-Alexandrium_andersonii.AAC.1